MDTAVIAPLMGSMMEMAVHSHHHGAHHLHGLHLHEAANRLHVAGAALDKVTRLHAHMIAVWHGLQMREQPVAQALGQSLARKGDAVAAQIGEYAAQQRHQNHKRGQHPECGSRNTPARPCAGTERRAAGSSGVWSPMTLSTVKETTSGVT